MKKPNRHQLVAIMAIAIGLTTAGIGISHAASTDAVAGINPMNKIVSAIATKFNLDASDVQQVFDEQHAQMEAEHKQQEAARLTQAVTDGKLTQEQADKITAKQAELEANRTSMQGKTTAERQAAMKTEMESLKQWVTDNKIPQEFMHFGGPGMGGKGHGFGGPGRHNNPDDVETSTPTPTPTDQ